MIANSIMIVPNTSGYISKLILLVTVQVTIYPTNQNLLVAVVL